MSLSASGGFAYRVVGVVHVPALPGTARGGTAASMPGVLDAVRRDAAAYAAGGVSALMVENFGDVPFLKDHVRPETIAALTLAVAATIAETGLPVGVNVLRNDVLAAVGIAAATGAGFIRANVYTGAMLTDQGIIEGRAEEVQAAIRRLGADISVWADADVKHAASLAPRPIGDVAEDAVERGLAGAIIVSGRATGSPVAMDDLSAVRAAVPGTPLYIGSGARADNAAASLAVADGLIVGTAAKRDGVVTNPVDERRVREIVTAASR
ncbi:MAG: BtpA/SgcQ family protein [Chloroflexota bacterium]|nr:BtpA/SgcQ family protein [Chloroflexota bacterium]MDQ3514844.1 BtpA/SgcQ family protein [Chloroflexota bacterium]